MPKVATTEMTEVTEVYLAMTLMKGYFKLLIPEITSVIPVISVARKKPSKKGFRSKGINDDERT